MIAESLSSRNAAAPLFDGVEITSDTLTGRGGLALFSRYLRNLEIFPHLFCFFLDGTSRAGRRSILMRPDATATLKEVTLIASDRPADLAVPFDFGPVDALLPTLSYRFQ